MELTTLSTKYFGNILVWGGAGAQTVGAAGSAVYEFSGDTSGRFACTTRPTMGDDGLGSCTGPENDFVNYVSGAEWPALTTTGKPIAGPGVDQKLLGTVQRPGIGDQVTYAGHPLYLQDRPEENFDPEAGDGLLESVSPYPWHGIWWLVSPRDGSPVASGLEVEPETLPDDRAALAYRPSAQCGSVAVYTYSLDRPGVSACTGACAVTWPPLLTRGKPVIDPNVTNSPIVAQDLGFIRRPDGTEQATYKGKPLYVYSAERYLSQYSNGFSLTVTGGNGNGLRWPKGGTFSVVYLGQ